MPTPRPSSTPSRACRIELCASRQLAAALLVLGMLGCVSWVLSDAGLLLGAAGSGVVLIAAAHLAAREATRPTLEIHLAADGRVLVDGSPVDDFAVTWRGPLTAVRWRAGGRWRRRMAFPDALDAASRRELRLRALTRRESVPTAAVAP